MLWSLANRPARAASSTGEAPGLFTFKTLARSFEIIPKSHGTDPEPSINTICDREELDALLPTQWRGLHPL